MKTAIITGASRGIGKAVASKLAANGLAVVVNFAGSQDEANAVVSELTAIGGRAIAVKADVSKCEEVKALFDAAEKAYGGVDVLVNNAGIMITKTLGELADDEFDRMCAINLRGTFNTLKQAATRLRNGGSIVNLSSSVVELAFPTYAGYSATKAAVEAMTRIFSKELRGKAITVNAIAPGPTATDLFLKGKTQESIDHLAKMPPLERLGTPEDIANSVAFLVSSEGNWINGQVLRANGGII